MTGIEAGSILIWKSDVFASVIESGSLRSSVAMLLSSSFVSLVMFAMSDWFSNCFSSDFGIVIFALSVAFGACLIESDLM